MRWDKQNLFSDKQALASGNSTNVVRVQNGPGDFGVGDDVKLAVHVQGAPGTATALTVTIQMSDTAAMTAPETLVTYPVPAADVQAGGLAFAATLPGGAVGKYLRLAYAITTGGGFVTAGLVKDAPMGVRP